MDQYQQEAQLRLSRSFKVITVGTNRKLVCDFLLSIKLTFANSLSVSGIMTLCVIYAMLGIQFL